jgi:hypothetical protein
MLPDAGWQRMQQHHNENDSQLQVATHTSGVAADVKICAMALRLLLEPERGTNPGTRSNRRPTAHEMDA